MQRWEFDSIARAASCISSWFSGTLPERLLLKEYLDSAIGILLSFYILGQRKNNLLLFLDTCRVLCLIVDMVLDTETFQF